MTKPFLSQPQSTTDFSQPAPATDKDSDIGMVMVRQPRAFSDL